MKLLQNTRFTGTALLLLLLLNTTLLVLLLLADRSAPEMAPPGPPGHRGPRDFLVRELKMDKVQQEKYDTLIMDHRSQVERLQENIRGHRDALVLQFGKPDTSAIDSLADGIGKTQAEIERVTFQHFSKVRDICTPEQRPKFDTLIRQALRMMGPPPPGDHPPGSHQPGPPGGHPR